MKILFKAKDGGADSHVWGYWLCEFKSLFSIAVLRFEHGTRDVYHSHAFNCISWVLRGKLEERHLTGETEFHTPSLKPIITKRDTYHKVFSHGRTWLITFRGPWSKTWKESQHINDINTILTHGRKVVGKEA